MIDIVNIDPALLENIIIGVVAFIGIAIFLYGMKEPRHGKE